MFVLTDCERNYLQGVRRNALDRMSSLETEMERLEHDLDVLKARYREARRIDCDAVNMINRVEKFDRGRLEFKW